MERFVSENPGPVLRIGRDERVIYSNKAGKLFLQEWNIRVGEKVPISIGNFSNRAISRKDPEKTQIKVGKRIYLISFYPLEAEEQVNVYGFDITKYKKLVSIQLSIFLIYFSYKLNIYFFHHIYYKNRCILGRDL